MDISTPPAPPARTTAVPVPRTPADPAGADVPRAAPPGPDASLGKEVRESALLLGLSLGVTAGLTVALQAALSVLS